jgi:membrane-associated phospholipid phosphatase
VTATHDPAPAGSRGSVPARTLTGRFGARAVVAAIGVVLVVVPLTLLVVLVLAKSRRLRAVDQGIEDVVHRYVVARPALERALEIGSVVLHPRVMWALAAITFVALWVRGRRRHAVWAVVTIAIGGALDTPLKDLIARARPIFPDPVATAPGYSFPSGHALNTMVVAAGAVVLGRRATRDRPGRRAALLLAAAALVLLTGFDRVGLGVHYPSDVVGGWLVGLATVLVTTAAFDVDVSPAEREQDETPDSRREARQ